MFERLRPITFSTSPSRFDGCILVPPPVAGRTIDFSLGAWEERAAISLVPLVGSIELQRALLEVSSSPILDWELSSISFSVHRECRWLSVLFLHLFLSLFCLFGLV